MMTQKGTTNFLKGISIGFGTLIPGLSGGTTAMVLGVFEDILNATANFFSNVKKSLKILFPIISGVIVGVLLFSYPIDLFCECFPRISKVLFAIISLISAIIFAKKNFKKGFRRKDIILVITGTLCCCVLSVITNNNQISFSDGEIILLFIVGVALSLALILPAISFSYMMLYFGIYESTLNAIHNINISYLLPLFLGVLIGSFLFSKLLCRLIEKHERETYSVILGFIIISLLDILT